jgi:DNA polymerase
MDEARRKRVLRQHVKTDQLLGAQEVPLGEAASADEAEASPAPVARAAAVRPIAAPPSLGRVAPPPVSRVSPPPPAPVKPAAPAPLMSVAAPLGPELPTDQKVVALRQLDESQVKGCTRCPLHAGRTQTVFGEGNPDAKLLFIGEGPGQTEDELGRPFVGKAGELLDKMIVAMGLARQDVFIANVVKCRPPNNRTPTPAEVDACSTYLVEQIRIIRPRMIVTLGGPATKFILQTDRGITSIRGIWHQWLGLGPDAPIPVMPTFHPAYLLRAYTPENRGKVWSDLQKVMSLLNES